MAHRTVKSGYDELVDRLNRAPQGAPPSELLNRILAMMMDEKEAGLLALLPIKPFTAAKAASIWKVPEAEARNVLDRQLENLGDLARFIHAHVASVMQGQPDLVSDPAFLDSFDLDSMGIGKGGVGHDASFDPTVLHKYHTT